MALPELQDGAKSKQKAEYVAHTLSKRGKSDYIELTYKRLDGPNPGAESKTGNFVTELDESSRNLIKAKGEFVVVKTKSGKFWPLTSVESIDTYVAKAPSTYNGNKGGYVNKSSGTTFNNAGIKVGAVLHDAVALVSSQKGYDIPTTDVIKLVKEMAEKLLAVSYELEANVNAGKYEPKGSTAKASILAKPIDTSRSAEPNATDEDLGIDNIDF